MEKTKIEYCDSTWNPVTGCAHNCRYCYAKVIANRFKGCMESPDGKTESILAVLDEPKKRKTKSGAMMPAPYPYGFIPTFHKYRLNDLSTKHFGKTIFVCSTADLFDFIMPTEWIREVFAKCLEHPEHRYLFLTKNPFRYDSLADEGILPNNSNFWYGTTLEKMSFYFNKPGYNCFLSIEPIMSNVFSERKKPDGIKWMVMGAMTGRERKHFIPTIERVQYICDAAEGIPIFMKDSLLPIIGTAGMRRELPWEVLGNDQEIGCDRDQKTPGGLPGN